MAKDGNRNPRDDTLPDYVERAHRLRDLIEAPVLPFGEVPLYLDLPASTFQKLHVEGRGPRTFKIGRRLYVRQADLRAWLDQMAEAQAA